MKKVVKNYNEFINENKLYENMKSYWESLYADEFPYMEHENIWHNLESDIRKFDIEDYYSEKNSQYTYYLPREGFYTIGVKPEHYKEYLQASKRNDYDGFVYIDNEKEIIDAISKEFVINTRKLMEWDTKILFVDVDKAREYNNKNGKFKKLGILLMNIISEKRMMKNGYDFADTEWVLGNKELPDNPHGKMEYD
jgi:hypothetical protein